MKKDKPEPFFVKLERRMDEENLEFENCDAKRIEGIEISYTLLLFLILTVIGWMI